jgi:hypothetical protein
MRTKLSEDGIVHDDSFKDFEEALTSFWRNKRRQNLLTHPTHTEIQSGQLIFSDCCLHRQKLQGLELPDYFTPAASKRSLMKCKSAGTRHMRLL